MEFVPAPTWLHVVPLRRYTCPFVVDDAYSARPVPSSKASKSVAAPPSPGSGVHAVPSQLHTVGCEPVTGLPAKSRGPAPTSRVSSVTAAVGSPPASERNVVPSQLAMVGA